MNWAILAFLAAICNAVYVMVYTYVMREKFPNLTSTELILNFCIFMAIIGIIVYLIYPKSKIVFLDKEVMNWKMGLLVAIGVVTLGLYCKFMIDSIKQAKNPNYTFAIINMNVIFFFLISLVLFGHKINTMSIIGLCMAVGGIAIILLNNDKESKLEMKVLDKYFK